MGCYGIGVGRLLAACVEVLSSPSCLRFPRLLAPHQLLIIPQKVPPRSLTLALHAELLLSLLLLLSLSLNFTKDGYKSEVTNQLSLQLYDRLTDLSNFNNEVVIDDRTQFSIGQRIKQASSIGYPFAVAIGKKVCD